MEILRSTAKIKEHKQGVNSPKDNNGDHLCSYYNKDQLKQYINIVELTQYVHNEVILTS